MEKVKTNPDLSNLVNALNGNILNLETLTQLVLNASAVIKSQKGQAEILDTIERHTREYICMYTRSNRRGWQC